MKITAKISNRQGRNDVTLTTNEHTHALEIPVRASGYGSSANGGELLFLALASCYCNDLYREAAKKNLQIEMVEIEVEGDFGAEGEPGSNIIYHARVTSGATEAEIQELMAHTDQVAEIQNTLRAGRSVTLVRTEVITKK